MLKNPASHLTKMWYFETLLNVFRVLKGFLQHLTALTCSCGFLTMLYQAEMMSFSSWSCLERVLSESCWNTQRRAWDQHHHTHTDSQINSVCVSDLQVLDLLVLLRQLVLQHLNFSRNHAGLLLGVQSLYDLKHTHTWRSGKLSSHYTALSLCSLYWRCELSPRISCIAPPSVSCLHPSSSGYPAARRSSSPLTHTHTHRQRVSSSLSDMAEAQMFL